MINIGGNIAEMSVGNMPIRNAYVGSQLVWGESPIYDAKIEYLGFAQNCNINTGIIPSTNYKYYWKYLWTGRTNYTYPFTNSGNRGNWFIFGGIETSNKTQIHIRSSYTGGWQCPKCKHII